MHDETLGKGTIKLRVTENGLIEVIREGRENIHAYFNTTKENVKLAGEAELNQGFENSVLAPKGFAIMVR